MKTTQKLMLFCALFTAIVLAETKLNAQPLSLEIAECQDFFGSLQRGDLNSIKACLDKKPEYIYPQMWGDFIANLSVLDMMFTCGAKVREIVLV